MRRIIVVLLIIMIHALRMADHIMGRKSIVYHIEYVDMEHVRLTPTKEE